MEQTLGVALAYYAVGTGTAELMLAFKNLRVRRIGRVLKLAVPFAAGAYTVNFALLVNPLLKPPIQYLIGGFVLALIWPVISILILERIGWLSPAADE